jgi:hypothetical protein
VPIWQIGKRREALTGNSEIYKKHIVHFLEKRQYYLKASSDVEATFADCILSRKDEVREYWLEAKATKISLGDSSFLSQLGKYLAEYVIRTPSNRFKMILACYNIRNLRLFEQVFQKFESEAIEKTVSNIVEVSQPNVRAIIAKANSEDIRKFFEETTVIVANPAELQIAEEKIAPPVPTAPTLSDAEYAAEILSGFGDIEPLKGPDVTCLNLFELSTPEKLYIGETPYRTPKSIYREKPNVSFPSFRLESGKLYSFSEMNQDTLLGKFVDLNSVVAVDVKEFDKDENSQRIIVRILNKWIRNECRDMGLQPNKRTRSYFFPKKSNDDNPVTVVWIPKSRRSKRELTKPMMTNGRINYWVHRAAVIRARKFWGNYYVQIRPRWLFSSEGIYPFEGPRADRLDRAFRKSIYNRNLSQLYDALFWYRYIFSETDVLGNLRLDNLTKTGREQLIKVTEQVKVKSDRKPNVEFEEDIEKLDIIESQQVSFFVKTLDEFV